MIWPAGTNSFWMMPLLSKMAINSVLTLDFLQMTLSWSLGKLVNTMPSIAILILDRTDSIRSHLPWLCFPKVTHRNEVFRSFHPFCFLLVCELVQHKLEADFPLTQIIVDDGVHHVLANAQYLCNQSPIFCQHLSRFLNHLWVSACRWLTWTWLILSSFLPFAKAFEPFVNISCSQLPSSTPAPTFHVSPLQFSWFVAEHDVCILLHCAVTLSLILTMFTWSQLVYTAGHMQSMLCVDSPHVWSAHMCQVALQIWQHSPNC